MKQLTSEKYLEKCQKYVCFMKTSCRFHSSHRFKIFTWISVLQVFIILHTDMLSLRWHFQWWQGWNESWVNISWGNFAYYSVVDYCIKHKLIISLFIFQLILIFIKQFCVWLVSNFLKSYNNILISNFTLIML